MKIRIEDQEFKERVCKTQKIMKQEGLDMLLAYGIEA